MKDRHSFFNAPSPSAAEELHEFNPERFYQIGFDEELASVMPDEDATYVYLKPKGSLLLSQYYHDKYNADITVIKGNRDELIHKIEKIREQHPNDGRWGFIYTDGYGKHSTPITYIRENNEEIIFIADSLGKMRWIEEKIHQEIDREMPIYSVQNARQSDKYSCHVDAQVFMRETVGQDHEGNYFTPKLLQTLKLKSEKSDDHKIYHAKLPDTLLITAQKTKFIKHHRSPDNDGIESTPDQKLDQFLKKHSKTIEFENDEGEVKKHTINMYLSEKGRKYANLIEIQYYLNQLKEKLTSKMTDPVINQFIKGAKQELKSQGLSHENKRPGLYEFSKNFFISHLKSEIHHKDKPNKKI